MKLTTIVFPVVLATAACASSQPTHELVQAREAYTRATQAPQTRLAPASLLSARQALDKAEAVHESDPQSEKERSYAYIAQRRAELAVVDGTMQQDRNDRTALEQQYDQLQNSQRIAAQNQLGTSQAQVQNLSTQLLVERERTNATGAALESERARTQRALASLEKIATIKEEARGTVLTLSGQVLFVTGKSELLPVARDQLGQVAKALQDDNRPIVVEGYTDSRGSDAMNLKLSQERAEAVRSFLVGAGVPANRLTAIGRGESDPVASNDTPEGRANNRRVEIILGNDARPDVTGSR